MSVKTEQSGHWNLITKADVGVYITINIFPEIPQHYMTSSVATSGPPPPPTRLTSRSGLLCSHPRRSNVMSNGTYAEQTPVNNFATINQSVSDQLNSSLWSCVFKTWKTERHVFTGVRSSQVVSTTSLERFHPWTWDSNWELVTAALHSFGSLLHISFKDLQNLQCAEHFLWISRTIREGEQEIQEDIKLETEEGSEVVIWWVVLYCQEICPGASTRVVFCSTVVSVADLLLAKWDWQSKSCKNCCLSTRSLGSLRALPTRQPAHCAQSAFLATSLSARWSSPDGLPVWLT